MSQEKSRADVEIPRLRLGMTWVVSGGGWQWGLGHSGEFGLSEDRAGAVEFPFLW